MDLRSSRGVTLIEMLISMSVLLLAFTGVATLLVQNSRINKSQQMTVDVQTNARLCLSLVVEKLRSGGWDPMNAGFAPVNLDADTSDPVSEIEILADLDEDGLTLTAYEQIMIRHTGSEVRWRTTPTSAFTLLADNITNDSDGDGTPEPMFVPDSTVAPSQIEVVVTAESPAPDPVSGEPIRYTVRSNVALRVNL